MRAGPLGAEGWGGAGQRTRESFTPRLHGGLTLHGGLEEPPLLNGPKETAWPLHCREPVVLRPPEASLLPREAALGAFTLVTGLSLGRRPRQGAAPFGQRLESSLVGGQGSRELRALPEQEESRQHPAWKVRTLGAQWKHHQDKRPLVDKTLIRRRPEVSSSSSVGL